MRLDKFMKVTQLIKRRTVANEAATEGTISVDGRKVKASYNVKIGDKILLDFWNFSKELEVLDIPKSNSIKKDSLDDYIKLLDYKSKNVHDM